MNRFSLIGLLFFFPGIIQAQHHNGSQPIRFPIPDNATNIAPVNQTSSGQFPIRFAPHSSSTHTIRTDPVYNKNSADTFVVHPAPIPKKSEPIGHTTRHLMSYQANSIRKATAIPMLGNTTQHSLKRYEDSFSHTLPEWFEERVNDTAK